MTRKSLTNDTIFIGTPFVIENTGNKPNAHQFRHGYTLKYFHVMEYTAVLQNIRNRPMLSTPVDLKNKMLSKKRNSRTLPTP